MVACQTDINEVGVVADGVSAVEFEVGAPQMRAYSDGSTATVLQYAVYEVKGEGTNKTLTYLDALTAAGEDAETLADGKANVKIELANNKKYAVIFWASAAVDGPYTFNPAAMTVTVNYDGAVCNDESRDAFYAYKEFEVKGAATLSVELRRPFAQLNVGTSDLTAAQNSGFNPLTSALVVKNVCNVLNLETGVASGDVDAEFGAYAVPTGEDFPVAGYDYLAMSYVLVGKDQAACDVTYTIEATDGTIIPNTIGAVPMRANYRTNIYGKLLTSKTDINVEINPDYNEPDYSVYNVMVDGVSYDDFAVAVAKAMELNKPIEFVQNVTIDADETITVPAGKVLTLNLNGHTLSGVTDDADKNDDGNITSADNEVMFDVRGTVNVNGGRVTIKHVGEDYENFGWNACGEVFYVAFNGVLNVNNSHIENFGGVQMAYAIDLVNAGTETRAFADNGKGVLLDVDNSTLKSSYIPVRVFNNSAGMNNVEITNSTLEGTSRAFWVHIYTPADDASYFNSGKDTDGNGYKNETLNINIFNPTCNNTFKANSEDRLIEYGFTNEINVTPQGVIVMKDAEGNVIEGIGMDLEGNYAVTAPAGLDWVAAQVDSGNETFVGKTVKLYNDIDLTGTEWNPIGDNRNDDTYFKGTFDGQNHTIKGASKSSFDGSNYGNQEGWGIFSVVEEATIKNLNIDNAVFGSYTVISGAVAAYASDTTFENINITNTKVAGYNWYTGGVVGWAAGECTFKGINLDSTTAVGTLWDSHGQCAGGIAGGISSKANITIEDCNIACVLDVINDVTSNYKWWVYRVSGMIIGNISTTQEIDGRNYPNPSNVTCKNVTVTYGDWMNYHYCEGYWNRGWGRVESSDYVDGIDHTQCNHPAGESHYVCVPFDQLFGGGPNGDGRSPVYGLREYTGVKVNYPASYRREVASVAALNDALGKGVSVILDADIDYGTNQLAITGENQVVDLGGHALTTANNWGGISLKNGASIKNGTITHAGNTAAIKAFNGTSVENVTINATCATADKTVTGIAVQQGVTVESIKNVTINGVSQGIEVGYQATVGLIENAVVNESNNGTAKGIGLVINGGKVGKAKDCTFKGETYGITLHLKGVFAAGLELENCKVEGTTASIYAWDEKGISNTSGSLVLTYDAATTLTGEFVWDFEEECQGVVTLNRPQ